MISKYKRVNNKTTLLGILIVVIIVALGAILNASKVSSDKNDSKNTPMAIAKQFGINLHTADAKKVADYREIDTISSKNLDMTKGDDGVQAQLKVRGQAINKITKSLDKNIQPLMTEKEYGSVQGNRYNILSAQVCANGNYTSQVTDLILDKNLYADKTNMAGYHYEAKLKFISSDGKAEKTDTIKGYIGLSKENGQWKVSIYKLTEGPKLYLEQMGKNIGA